MAGTVNPQLRRWAVFRCWCLTGQGQLSATLGNSHSRPRSGRLDQSTHVAADDCRQRSRWEWHPAHADRDGV